MYTQCRRLNLIKAVEGDDWSSVIDEQTQSTVSSPAAVDNSNEPAHPAASPFSRAAVHRGIGKGAPGEGGESQQSILTPMTIESVDKALDEVCGVSIYLFCL